MCVCEFCPLARPVGMGNPGNAELGLELPFTGITTAKTWVPKQEPGAQSLDAALRQQLRLQDPARQLDLGPEQRETRPLLVVTGSRPAAGGGPILPAPAATSQHAPQNEPMLCTRINEPSPTPLGDSLPLHLTRS